MHLKTTLTLLLAVLLAAGALWYLEGREEVTERRHREVARLLQVHPERVRELVFDTGDKRIHCRIADDGVWRLIQPVNARADAGEIDRILSTLSTLAHTEIITQRDRRELGLSLRDFGLERPDARIEWEDEHGRRVLLIGRSAPVGEAVYVRLEGQDDLYSVSSQLLDILPDSVLALRDRVLFHGSPRRTYRLEVRRADGFLQLMKADDGSWRLQQPLAAAASRGAVRQLVDRIFEWRIEEFVADGISDATVYGLDDEAIQVTVYTEGQEAGQTVLLGAERDQQNGRVYARRQDGQSVFAVSRQTLEEVRIRPNDLRDRALFRISPQEMASVMVERGEEVLHLERTTNAVWAIRSPKHWKADSARVKELLEAWSDARITRFMDEPEADLETLGFTEDALRITFQTRPAPHTLPHGGQAPVQSVTVWISDIPAEDGRLLVKKVNEPFLYEITAPIELGTPVNPLYYRHREMIRLDKESISRVSQTIDGMDRVVVRNSTDRFVPSSAMPEDAALSNAVLAAALETLTDLKADEFVVDAPADWAPYGLDEPRVTWSLDLTGAAGLRRVLMLGDVRGDGRAYARTLGHDVVFLLDATDSARLMRDLFEEAPAPIPDEPDRIPDEGNDAS